MDSLLHEQQLLYSTFARCNTHLCNFDCLIPSALLSQKACLCVVVVVIRIIPRFLAMESITEFERTTAGL